MITKGYLKSERGVTPTGALIFVVVFTLLIIVGISVGKPFLLSLSFNSEAKSIAKNCIKKSDEVLFRNLRELAREKDFNLKDSDIKVSRNEETESIHLEVKYTYDLKLPYYEKTLIFNTTADESIGGVAVRGISDETKEGSEKAKGFFEKVKEIFGL